MKKITSLFLLLGTVTMMSGQILQKETLIAIKKGDVANLVASTIPSQINSCYDQKGAKFSLLGLSIKSRSSAAFDYLIAQEELDPNKACDNISPLMYAAKYGKTDMFKQLIEKGADPKREYAGKTAAYYAKKYKRQEIRDYLATL